MEEYRRLTREERYQIEALIASGATIRSVSRQLGRSASTISREMAKQSGCNYVALTAQRAANTRKRAPHLARRKIRGKLKSRIDEKLRLDWSPEQIVGRMKLGKEGNIPSYQTIYRYIYRDKKAGGLLWKHMRFLRKGNYFKMVPKAQRYRRIANRTMIEERSQVVESRERLGDYERDTMLGVFNGAVLLTIVDRSSRLLRIDWLRTKCPHLTHKSTVSLLKGLPVNTITNDNGGEFGKHLATAKKLKAKIYFSKAYRAWERGSNENLNGLIRQYFPRRRPIERVSRKKLKAIENLLNNRPRKCLGYKTPNEIQKLKSAGVALAV